MGKLKALVQKVMCGGGAGVVGSRISSRRVMSSSSVPRDWTYLTKEQMEAMLTYIQEVLGGNRELTATPSESWLSDAVNGNIEVCSSIFEEVGQAAYQSNSQKVSAEQQSNEFLGQFANVVEGLGNLHWIGAGLSVVAFCIKRYSQVQNNITECWEELRKLSDVLELTLNAIEMLSEEKLKKVFRLISQYVAECLQQINSSLSSRVLYATTNGDRVQRLNKAIEHLFLDLNLRITIGNGTSPIGRPAFRDHDDVVGLCNWVAEILCSSEEDGAGDEVRVSVIWGMPGVGTSTVGEGLSARLLKEMVERGFRDPTSCWVSMKQLSTEHEFAIKQAQIIEVLSKKKLKFLDCKAGQKGLTDCFKKLSEPVLIFLDDVESEEQLRYLLPQDLGRDLPRGSRVLVSTFDARVCDVIRNEKGISFCQLYEMKELGREQAKELFCRIAFENPEVPMQLKKEVDSVLKICGGLPLALKVIGMDVRSKGSDVRTRKAVLHHAVQTLSDGDPLRGTKANRLATLKCAYDQLGEGSALHTAFLDISANFVGRSWEEMELLYGQNLLTLKELSLVKQEKHVYSDGKSQTVLEMHLLLVALGQRQGREYDGVRVVAKNETCPDCPRDPAGLRNVELLHLDHCDLPFPVANFKRCLKLRHLELFGIVIKESSTWFPTKLQSLKFCCPNGRLPFPLAQMENLLFLQISSNHLADKDLGCTLKLSPKLRKLKLSDSETLKEIEKGLCTSLEQVVICNCPNLEEIGGLSPNLSPTLKTLFIMQCPKIAFSELASFHSLEKLSLIDCGLETGNLKLPSNLHFLNLSNNTNLVRLPDFVHSKLKTLTLQNCSNLVDVPQALWHLLRPEDIEGCLKLTNLPDRLKTSSTQSSTADYINSCLHQLTRKVRKCTSEIIFRSKENKDLRKVKTWKGRTGFPKGCQ